MRVFLNLRFPLWRIFAPGVDGEESSGGASPPAGEHQGSPAEGQRGSSVEGQHGVPGQGGASSEVKEEAKQAIVDLLADLVHQRTQRSTEGYQGQSLTPGTSTLEIRQKLQVPIWTGNVDKGGSLQVAFVVFKSAFLEYLASEGLDDVLHEPEEIPVGRPGVDFHLLNSVFTPERVRKSRTVWNLLICKITDNQVLQIILASGSPQKGWHMFVKYYEEQKDTEKEKLELEWSHLKQYEDENVVEYLGRAATIRMKLVSLGKKFATESEHCKHVARRLNSSFAMARDFLLLQTELKSERMELMLRQADHERRHSGRREDGREEGTRHALFASYAGRSDRYAAAGMARSGRGMQAASWEREKGRGRQPFFYCRIHGENSSHGTWDCLTVRSQFEQYLAERETPVEEYQPEGRTTGRHLDGLRHNGAFQRPEGPQRTPPHLDAGGNWIRGRPPPRPPQPRGRGNGSFYPGRHPGGREFEGERSSGGRGRGRGGNYPPPRDAQRQPFSNRPPRQAFYAHPPDGYPYGEVSDGRWGSSGWVPHEQQQGYMEEYGYGLSAQGGGYGGGSGGYGDSRFDNDGGGYGTSNFSAGGEIRQEHAGGAAFEGSHQGFSAAGPDVFQPARYEEPYGPSSSEQEWQQQHQQGHHTQHPSSAVPSSSQPSSSSSPGASSSQDPVYSCMALSVSAGELKDSELVSGVVSDSSSFRIDERLRVTECVSARSASAALLCEERSSITPCPPKSEKWTCDSGSTSSVTNDCSMMFGMRVPEPHRAFIQIGDKGFVPVEGVGCVNLKFHQRKEDGRLVDFTVQLTDVLFAPKIGFNLFSAWKASQRQVVTLDPKGTHLMQGNLNFVRGPSSDFLYATRVPHNPHQQVIDVPPLLESSPSLPIESNISTQSSMYDLSLCVETFPGMHLGREVESVLSDVGTSVMNEDSAWCFVPDPLTENEAELQAAEFDRREASESAHAVLGPGATPFIVGNRVSTFDINDFHRRNGHLSEFLLRETAKQQGISLTGRMEPCEDCMAAKGRQASVSSKGGGRAKEPNDLVHLDFCGPYTPSIGGNFYLLVAVDSASRYIKPYALRRRSEGLAAFKRCVVDLAHLAKRPVRAIRVDNDSVWTSTAFRDFCASAGIDVQFSPPGVQQYNGVAESAIWRIMKGGMAARRCAARSLGPDGFSNIPGLDPRGDKLWAESAKYSAEAFNQSGTTANEGRRSPQEVYTGKKGPFRLLPFFVRGFMRVNRATKMDDQAVPCYYLNGGDNHGAATVKVMKASTGYVCYTSNVSWAPLSSSGGGDSGGVRVSPSAPAPLPSPAPAFSHPAWFSPSQYRFKLLQIRRDSERAYGAPPTQRQSPSSPIPSAQRQSPSSPMPAWSPSTIREAPSPSGSSGSSSAARTDQQQQPRTRQPYQPPTPPAGYPPLTPHAARQLGREGDPRIPGRTRQQGRAIADQGISPPDGAVNTPVPEPSSSRDVHAMGLVSQADRDVLLSMLATKEVVEQERKQACPVKENGVSFGVSEFCGVGNSVGSSGVEESQDAEQDESKRDGWAKSALISTLKWARSFATREEIDEVLRDQEPPAQRPEMPLCHARDLRTPKHYKDAVEGEFGTHFRDAMQREVHGLVEAGTFEPVDK